MTDIDTLFDTIARYMQAKDDEYEAREDYDGYSWDYSGHSYIERVSETKKEAQDLFNQYLDERIQARVKAGSLKPL
jgi:hypothetical protein